MNADNTGLGLYVHIPFCHSRCGYCTFTSGIYDEATADAYLTGLAREIAARNIANTPFATLFIGGGTPSCLSSAQLSTLFSILPTVSGEATCEMNPDSATPEKLRLLQEHGINRVSFGVQTFSPDGLRLLGRRHDASQAIRAVEWANQVGFPRGVNIDLINSWPGQGLTIIENDIKISISLNIQHLSNYSLIIEDDAPGYEQYIGGMEGGEEAERRSWDFIEEYLGNYGFNHYETSNFSLRGFECAHNVEIWRGGEYYGIGLGSHSHVAGRRFANTTDLEKYIKCSNTIEELEVFSEILEGREKARECTVFWLRLFEGVDTKEFLRRTGVDFFALYAGVLEGMIESGVMEVERGYVRVARKYQPLLDMVLADLV